MKQQHIAGIIGVLGLVLAACAPAATVAAPTPTKGFSLPAATATPTQALPQAGGTRAPTPTPRPAATPEPTPGAPKYGGTFTIHLRSDPVGWEPFSPGAGGTRSAIVRALFGKMIELQRNHETCKQEFGLAFLQEWKWLNDTKLQLTVRPGVGFQSKPPVNGREMTANDLAFSLNRIKGKPITFSYVTRYIEKAEVVDKYTATLQLNTPYASFPIENFGVNYDFAVLAPEAAGPDGGYGDPDKSYIGAGPFGWKEWRPGVKISLVKNPNYFRKGQPYVDGVDVLIVPDMSTRFAMLRTGKFSILYEIPYVQAGSLRKTSPDIILTRCPSQNPVELATPVDGPPFNDVRVRRALNMAIDRKAIIDGIMGGEGYPTAYIPTWVQYAASPEELPSDARQYVEYNPEKARSLLAEAGYAKGLEFEIWTHTFYGTPWNEQVEASVAMFSAVGAKPKLVIKDYSYMRMINNDYPPGVLLMHMAGCPGTPDRCLGWLTIVKDNPNNYNRLADPELDRMVPAYFATADIAKRAQMVKDIQAYVARQSYGIAFPTHVEYVALQPWTKGFKYPDNVRGELFGVLDTVWLDK